MWRTHHIKQNEFEYDRHTVLTNWKSNVSGLTIVHFKRSIPVLRAHIVVDTVAGDDYGCARVLSKVYEKKCKQYPIKLKDALKKHNCTKEEIVQPNSITYSLTAYTEASLLAGIEILFCYILHFEPDDDELVAKFLRNDYTYRPESPLETYELDQALYGESLTRWETRTSVYPFGLKTSDIADFHKKTHQLNRICLIVEGVQDSDHILERVDFEGPSTYQDTPENSKSYLYLSHPKRVYSQYPIHKGYIHDVYHSFDRLDHASENCWTVGIPAHTTDATKKFALYVLYEYIHGQIRIELDEELNPLSWGFEDFLSSYLVFNSPDTLNDHLTYRMQLLIEKHCQPDRFDLIVARHCIELALKPDDMSVRDLQDRKVSRLYLIAKHDFLCGSKTSEDTKLLSNWVQIAQEVWTWNEYDWCKVIHKHLLGKRTTTIHGIASELTLLQESIEEHAELDIRNRFNYHLNLFDKEVQPISTNSPNVTSIGFPHGVSHSSAAAPFGSTGGLHPTFSTNLPFDLLFEEYNDLATTIYIVMDTSKIDPELVKYIALLSDIFDLHYSCHPEDQELLQNLISCEGINIGLEGELLESVTIRVRFVPKFYEQAVTLLQKVCYQLTLTIGALSNAIEDLSMIPPMGIPGQGLEPHLYEERSVVSQLSSSALRRFESEVSDEFAFGHEDELLEKVNRLKFQLFHPKNIKVFVLGNTKNLSRSVGVWEDIFKTYDPADHMLRHIRHLSPSHKYKNLSCFGKAYLEMNRSLLRSVGGTDMFCSSTYIRFDESVFAKISIAVSSLNSFQKSKSDMNYFKASFRYDLDSHCLKFTVWEDGDNFLGRYEGFRYFFLNRSLDRCLQSQIDYFHYFIQSSLSDFVAGRETPQGNALHKIKGILRKTKEDYLRDDDKSYDEIFLETLNKITLQDIVSTVNKYFPRLFDPKTSVVRHTRTVFTENLDYFTKLGYETVIEN